MHRRRFLTTTAGAAAATLATPAILGAQSATIVDLAAGTPELSTLVTAVQAAGLVDTLSGPGNFTVFAPPTAPSITCRMACSTGCWPTSRR